MAVGDLKLIQGSESSSSDTTPAEIRPPVGETWKIIALGMGVSEHTASAYCDLTQVDLTNGTEFTLMRAVGHTDGDDSPSMLMGGMLNRPYRNTSGDPGSMDDHHYMNVDSGWENKFKTEHMAFYADNNHYFKLKFGSSGTAWRYWFVQAIVIKDDS